MLTKGRGKEKFTISSWCDNQGKKKDYDEWGSGDKWAIWSHPLCSALELKSTTYLSITEASLVSSHRACSLPRGLHPSGHYGTSLYRKKFMVGRWCYCCLSIASRLKNNYHPKASYCWHDSEGTRNRRACVLLGLQTYFETKKRMMENSEQLVRVVI